jgi:hypothetical protein
LPSENAEMFECTARQVVTLSYSSRKVALNLGLWSESKNERDLGHWDAPVQAEVWSMMGMICSRPLFGRRAAMHGTIRQPLAEPAISLGRECAPPFTPTGI